MAIKDATITREEALVLISELVKWDNEKREEIYKQAKKEGVYIDNSLDGNDWLVKDVHKEAEKGTRKL